LDGVFIENDKVMPDLTRGFYDNLLLGRSACMYEVVGAIPVKLTLTTQMNEMLIKSFKAKEVTYALSQMFPTKASRPDGFSTHWDLCGEDV
jgi:hypothetical protein